MIWIRTRECCKVEVEVDLEDADANVEAEVDVDADVDVEANEVILNAGKAGLVLAEEERVLVVGALL